MYRTSAAVFVVLLAAMSGFGVPAVPAATFSRFIEAGPWVGGVTATSAVVKVRLSVAGLSVRLSVGQAGGASSFTEKRVSTASRVVPSALNDVLPSVHSFYNVDVDG